MIKYIKKIIQDRMLDRCLNDYMENIKFQSDAYRQWIETSEDWKKETYPEPSDDIVIFADKKATIDDCVPGLVTQYFNNHPMAVFLYGDEDYILKWNGHRADPWFKPCWSPDTLASFQYIGRFYAVKREILRNFPEETWKLYQNDTDSEEAYNFLLDLIAYIIQNYDIGADNKSSPIINVPKILAHVSFQEDVEDVEGDFEKNITRLFGPHTIPTQAAVSVIIPSKDNPSVLETCVSSLRKLTETPDGGQPEIIVVDNGSSDEHKIRYEELSAIYDFTYLYKPLDFNFSVMCNYGAAHAKGEYLLFLNDDMEIIQGDWLSKMLFCASMDHVGAVGAKLLYPGTDKIQHVGVTNLRNGPGHKLQYLHDSHTFYHGQNHHNYDMIGVTAACLLLSAEKFERAGKFCEDIAVAFNDVDLCFNLHELGYYNVQRNDVKLYHHESLSRGDDNLSKEKWQRLLREKDRLYQGHPQLKGVDPYHNPNLANNSGMYHPVYIYFTEVIEKISNPIKYTIKGGFESYTHDSLIVNIERAAFEPQLERDDPDDIFRIEGWTFVHGSDNIRFDSKLIIISDTGATYAVDIKKLFRPDVEIVYNNQSHLQLAGFMIRLPMGQLEGRSFRVGVLSFDRCSRLKLFKLSDLKIET